MPSSENLSLGKERNHANRSNDDDDDDNELNHVSLDTVYRLFNPHVPVIVCSKFGKAIGAMPANSCTSVSDSPPMVSLALRKGIRTDQIVRSSSRFSINWISFEPEKSRKAMIDLAKPSRVAGREIGDKLKENNLSYTIIRNTPVLSNACAFALCKVTKRVSTGDHDLFIASVTYASAIDDFTLDGYWRFKKYKPILYIGSIRPQPLVTIS